MSNSIYLNNKVGNIGIFCGPHPYNKRWDERNLKTGGIGGSEIWALKLSEALSKSNPLKNIFLFIDCDEVRYFGRVTIIPWRNFLTQKYAVDTHYDLFITSRMIFELRNVNINSDKTVLMCHDIWIIGENSTSDIMLSGKIDYVFYQSEYQKIRLLKNYPKINPDKMIKTFQAIDFDEYNVAGPIKKENKMLISSDRGRSIHFIISRICPLIKNKVPDFKVELCGYSNTDYSVYEQLGYIHSLGNLTHEDLVKKQMDSKIWIYANTGLMDDGMSECSETFCITAIENAAARNGIICSKWGCFSDTLHGYSGFLGNDLFDDFNIKPLSKEHFDEFSRLCADEAIKLLTDDQLLSEKSDEVYNICKNYTWDNAAETFNQLISK